MGFRPLDIAHCQFLKAEDRESRSSEFTPLLKRP